MTDFLRKYNMKTLANLFDTIPALGRRKEGKLISGERPLKIFISSVMNDDLSEARKEIVKYIKRSQGFVPWAFEFIPASSEDVEKGYLRQVREADFVIWLVGENTTEPVEKEIREALSSNRRLLAILMPVTQRDETTRNLIDEAGNYVKWAGVTADNPLLEVLEKTLLDEIIRAVRDKPGLGRISRLQELENGSRARCIARWQAAGVSLDKATELYLDRSLGRPPLQLINKLTEKGVVVVTGNYGAGKSLLAERIFQEHIRKSIDDSSLPVPVFIRASNGADDLKRQVLEASKGLGNPKAQGALVVIDGIDEAGLGNSSKILFDARSLVRTWDRSFVIITSRPSNIFAGAEEKYPIDELEEKDIIDLVFTISNIEINSNLIIVLPRSVRDAIKKPLFAILWARFLEQRRVGKPRTIGDLISFFIEDATQLLDNDVRERLEILAINVTDRGRSDIPWREIGTQTDINLLLGTRLVTKVDDRIGFPLPILAQWFAAHGLISGRIDFAEISLSMTRLERWRYPLIILTSLFSHDDVSRILTPVISSNPGIAAEIIIEGIPDFDFESHNELPPSMECGQRIRQIYAAWVSGMGGIAKHIAPIDEDGSLLTLGVNSTGGRLAEAWYNGEEELGELLELPIGFMALPEFAQGWYVARSGAVGSKMAWAWRWTLDGLTYEMENFVRRRRYILVGGHMFQEKMWELALNEMGFGEFYDRPMSLLELEQRALNRVRVYKTDQHTLWHELHNYTEEKRERGEEILQPPWPTSDIEYGKSGSIWEDYSKERVLERAVAVYGAALEEYEGLVNSLFSKLKPRMQIGTLLPVAMHGNIRFQDSPFGSRTPCLDWYFEPLTAGSNNVVSFDFADKIEKLIADDEQILLNQRMRPDAKEWISAFRSYSVLDIFNLSPVTKIVYEWLEDDLKRIKWM